eukprot:761512-Hanusia_phi.AAC.4
MDQRDRWSVPGGKEAPAGGGEKQEFISLGLDSDESDSDKRGGEQQESRPESTEVEQGTQDKEGEASIDKEPEGGSMLEGQTEPSPPVVKQSDRKRPLEKSKTSRPNVKKRK